MSATHSTPARRANATLLWLTGGALSSALIGYAALLIPAGHADLDARTAAFGVWLLTLPIFLLCAWLFRILLSRRERQSEIPAMVGAPGPGRFEVSPGLAWDLNRDPLCRKVAGRGGGPVDVPDTAHTVLHAAEAAVYALVETLPLSDDDRLQLENAIAEAIGAQRQHALALLIDAAHELVERDYDVFIAPERSGRRFEEVPS